MDVSNSLLSAAGGADALKAAIGIKLLSKVQDTHSAQAATLLADFSNSQPAPHPYAGKRFDIRG
jgi:hypothetical protein